MPNRRRILLVEDEPSLRKGIKLNVEAEGFLVADFPQADLAFESLQTERSNYSLGILDITTPGAFDGIELCKRLRQIGLEFPVIFLTARGRIEDKLEAFASGADDYMTKPFELEELIARLHIRLGRKQRVKIGRYELDLASACATAPGETTVRFNDKEIKMLQFLVQSRGRPVKRDFLLENVWGADLPTTRSIDNFIVKFRKIFEEDPAEPVHFITRHGVGYELSGVNIEQ
ncbi:MAG: response regulator transcription factor [Leptospirales bacterium]|nr:response regulator transcription factor [Leptospirales bacterium]